MARKIPSPEPPEDDGPNLLIGYARVSTSGQTLEGQLAALRAAGVAKENVFTDIMSGARTSRKGFDLAMRALRRGDTLVVFSLSRIGRTVRQLLDINERLLAEGVTLKSLTEEIDTRTPAGRLAFHMLAVVAQFERDVTIERTKHGVAAAQAAGLPHGRPRKLTDAQMKRIEKDLANRTLSVSAIAKRYGVAAPTIRYHFPKPRVEYLKKNTRG